MKFLTLFAFSDLSAKTTAAAINDKVQRSFTPELGARIFDRRDANGDLIFKRCSSAEGNEDCSVEDCKCMYSGSYCT
ncbi:hypothetical protein N7478_013070 [Penicillium angulare]|uniref:uncharacterized protein n=1 Tax=Penicillium angulare TaxID=116970 RepID=UPI00253F7E61|nr:uncharacterized protein N7478_013070 [Penicillium angulare]KAJ5256966.1 hypothetical protein N7478_013070 [Penicillium angulare]